MEFRPPLRPAERAMVAGASSEKATPRELFCDARIRDLARQARECGGTCPLRAEDVGSLEAGFETRSENEKGSGSGACSKEEVRELRARPHVGREVRREALRPAEPRLKCCQICHMLSVSATEMVDFPTTLNPENEILQQKIFISKL